MATRRLSARLRAAVVVLALAAGGLVLPAVHVGADPGPTVAEARRRLDKLNESVDVAVERYNESRVALDAARREAARVDARVARAEQAVKQVQQAMGSYAASLYKSGGIDPMVQMLSSDAASFLDRASTIDQIARSRADAMRLMKVARRRLADEQARARAALARVTAIANGLERTKREIVAQVAEQQSLLARVESAAARRARLAAEAERARLARASRSMRAPVNVSASGRAAVAVQWAYKELGKPYVWGATGPDSFDCSGLTMYVWGKAGVSLPHYSRAQFNSGVHVSRSELRPGDLVFYGNPIHHVGIYVGNGQKIAAPQTGDVVKLGSVDRPDYVGAVRP